MPDSAASAIPRLRPSVFPLLGVVAALGLALVDACVAIQYLAGGADQISRRVVVYAAAVNVMGGFAVGLAVAGLHLVGSVHRWVRTLVWTTALGSLFVVLNATLFDGPGISKQAYAPALRIVFPIIGVLAILAVVHRVMPRLASASRGLRLVFAGLGVAASIGITYVDGRLLPGYPMVHRQFALASFGLLLLALTLVAPRGYGRRGTVVALAMALLLGGAGFGFTWWQRAQFGVFKIRGAILTTPMPATAKAMLFIERLTLDRVAPVQRMATTDVDIPAEFFEQIDVRSELDALVPARQTLNVLWIAIDALRADRVGSIGPYGRKLTPELDAFARRSVLFTRAYTSAPASMYAYSGTLSGVYARSSKGYSDQFRAGYAIPQNFAFPALLQSKGFATGALTAFHPASQAEDPGFPTFREGFDFFNEGHPEAELFAPETTDRGLALISKLRLTKRPFFGWIHYMDPHAPYRFHEEFPFGKRPVDNYDSEVAFADREVGRLLLTLEKSGALEHTIVVIFGDHGEGFGEHNDEAHGWSLYEHQIHVPLIMRIPGVPAAAVSKAVTLTDIVPTLINVMSISDKEPRLGRDLSPLLVGKAPNWFDCAYSERPTSPKTWPGSLERMVVHDNQKLIWNPEADTYRVFDLIRDPAESYNRDDASNPRHALLRALMKEMDARIDSRWGGAAASRRTTQPVAIEFDAAAAALASSTTTADTWKAGGQVLRLLRAADCTWRAQNLAYIGEDRLRSLRAFAEQRVAAARPDSADAALFVEILALWRDPALIPVFQQRLKVATDGTEQQTAALALADLWRDDGRKVLEAARAHPDAFRRYRVQSALARIGVPDALAAMRAHLDADEATYLAVAMRGLGKSADRDVLRRFLMSTQKCWVDAVTCRAAGELAALAADDEHDAVLAAVAGVPDAAAREAATAALAKRFPDPAAMTKARERAQTLSAAATAFRGWDFKLAEQYLDGLIDPAAPKASPMPQPESDWDVRSSCQRGDRAKARGLIERILAGPAAPDLAARATKLAAHLAGEGGFDQTGEFKIAVVRAPVAERSEGRALVTGDVEITNTSTSFLFGGAFPANLRFSFFFLNKEGNADRSSYQCESWLPAAGIAPGETVRFTVLGRTPSLPGIYKVVLGAGFSAQMSDKTRTVWTGPDVTIATN